MSTAHDSAAQLATDAGFVSLVRSFLLACRAFSTPEHILQRPLFNVFDGSSIVAYDYLIGLCALLQAGLMGNSIYFLPFYSNYYRFAPRVPMF
jgi:hypothetical protein